MTAPSAANGVAPLVTIVIPCFNQASFLPEAIESALAQKDVAVEVIVVDDGSTDDTANVARRYPVALIEQQNTGLAAARNSGLAASRGDFVAFLDSDDILRPTAMSSGLAAFCRFPESAFVIGRYVLVDARRRLIAKPPADPLETDLYAAFLRRNPIAMHATVLYRRESVVAVGGFDPTLGACEDYDLYLRITRTAAVYRHDAVVAEYRRHGANMSNDAAFMLCEALGVLRKQRPCVDGDPARMKAYREGLRNWTTCYLHEMRRDLTGFERADRDGAPTGTRRALRASRRVLRAGGRTARRITRRLSRPRIGSVQMGHLRRIVPISEEFGFDRGRPVDRYYIESFLTEHAADIRGRVLEIGDDAYTKRFGGHAVRTADVLHINAGAPSATIVGSLEDPRILPEGVYDCMIVTQTLHIIFDVKAALTSIARALRPDGVLLLTVPGISQVDRAEWGATWSWSMTPYAVRRLLIEAFPAASVEVNAHGNVLTSTAFLYGLAAHELSPEELDTHDPAYPMLVTARVVPIS